ncbi:MAG: hypothetical protein ACLRIS_16870 [Flavonifractor plautii]
MDGFNRKVVKIGTITVLCAIVANFLPVLYLWIVYGEIPTGSQLASILSMIFAASAVSWIVQPLSYYGGLGMVGTYISWISGSAADIRLPSINMAQKVTNTEANTPEGDAIGAMALSASVLPQSESSVCLLWWEQNHPASSRSHYPVVTYMQPALFAAVFVNMAVKTCSPALRHWPLACSAALRCRSWDCPRHGLR